MNTANLPLFRIGCYLLALAAMAYISNKLYGYVTEDFVSHLPDVGLWLMGLSFSVMILANGKRLQVLNILPLSGLAGLVLIF